MIRLGIGHSFIPSNPLNTTKASRGDIHIFWPPHTMPSFIATQPFFGENAKGDTGKVSTRRIHSIFFNSTEVRSGEVV